MLYERACPEDQPILTKTLSIYLSSTMCCVHVLLSLLPLACCY